MRRYVLRRLLLSVPTLAGVSLFVFALVRLIPGDIVDRILGSQAAVTEERRQELRRLFGIDRPLLVQYADWVGRAARGDLGVSLLNGRPVFGDLLLRAPATIELATLSLGVALAIGVPLGVVAASRHHQWPDYVGSVFGMLGVSIPNFWLGTMLVFALSIGLGWFPSAGYVPLRENPLESLRLMVLPALALGLGEAAAIMRMVRSATLEVLHLDHVRTARAKGLAAGRVLWKHVLGNALIPVLTVTGLSAGYLLAGTVIIEHVFSIPGIGRFTLMGINNRDYPVVQGAILFVALIYFVTNLIVDLLYAVVDPRVRYG